MSITLEILLSRHNGKFNLSVIEIAQILGLSTTHVRNCLSEGIFPIPTFKLGGKRVARIDDVANYIDKISNQPPAKRRGPKTKLERIDEAKAAAKAEVNHA